MFFDPKRYDLAKVGRYKYNKKLGLYNRLADNVVDEDVADPNTGEILAEKGERVSKELARQIENAGVEYVMVRSNIDDDKSTKVIGNQFVDIDKYIEFDISDLKIAERVYYPVLMEILEEYKDAGQEEIREALKLRKNDLSPKHILVADIVASVSYLLNLNYGIGNIDDIDHLGNRRLRTVGELLQNQIRIGLTRMERTIKERMNTQDIAEVTPQSLMNIRPVTAAIKEFFGSSQLSQFMDQTNPTENFNALAAAIIKAKPAAAKGQYIRTAVVASTMGPGVKINPQKLG